MITKKQPNAWEIKRTVGLGVGGSRELFWAPRRGQELRGCLPPGGGSQM